MIRRAAFVAPIFGSAIGQSAMLLCVLALIWGVIWLHLRGEYRHAAQEAAEKSVVAVKAVEEHVSHSFEVLDDALLASRAHYLSDKDHFKIGPWMRDRAGIMRIAVQMSIADATGTVLTSSGDNGPPPVRIADREHFLVQAAATEDRLFISVPVIGRTSGRLSVQFTRRIVDPNGGFAGIVVASLDPLVITEPRTGIPENGGFTLLIGGDGIIRAARPQTGLIGEMFSEPALLKEINARGTAALPDGVRTVADDRAIVSYRNVAFSPFVVAAGFANAVVFATYEHERHIILATGAMLSLTVVFVSVIAIRHRGRLTRFHRALMLTMDNISQGILMIDQRRRMPVINRRVSELLGVPEELATPGADFDKLVEWQKGHDEFRTDTPEALRITTMVNAGGIDPDIPFYERTRANGTVLEIRTTVLADGSAVRTLTDVTERKRIEHEMVAARDAARAGERARTEFLAVMSHEIRTPMNGIIGAAGLLRDMDLTAEQREYVRIIGKSSDQLSSLIQNILDFTRLDSGRLELEEVAFDPRTLIQDTVAAQQGPAHAKGLTLKAVFGDGMPHRVSGDPRRLRQILENLINNGIKFTDRGGVTVEVRVDAADADTVTLRIAVIDTGVGIDPASKRKLSAAFTQADSSISRRFDGAGLGLAICRHLIALMGGTIEVDSEPGAGCTFRLGIPMRRAAAEASGDPADPGSPGPARRLKILLAEDNPTNRHVATRMLTRLGHAVDSVSDGARAITAAAEGDYDVILMDMMMPDVDGLTATRAIRAGAPPRGDVLIVALTANALPSDRAACEAAGMDDFVTKPVTLERLRVVLERAAAQTVAATQQPAAERSPDGVGLAGAVSLSDAVSLARAVSLTGTTNLAGAASLADAVALSDADNLDLDFLDQLALEIGPDGVAEMIGIFVEDAPAHMAAIRRGMADAAIQTVRREAHALAGAASNVGLTRLTEASRALQHASERSASVDPETVEAVAAALRDAVPLANDWATAHEGATIARTGT